VSEFVATFVGRVNLGRAASSRSRAARASVRGSGRCCAPSGGPRPLPLADAVRWSCGPKRSSWSATQRAWLAATVAVAYVSGREKIEYVLRCARRDAAGVRYNAGGRRVRRGTEPRYSLRVAANCR
jgi:hypothetical protein